MRGMAADLAAFFLTRSPPGQLSPAIFITNGRHIDMLTTRNALPSRKSLTTVAFMATGLLVLVLGCSSKKAGGAAGGAGGTSGGAGSSGAGASAVGGAGPAA